MCTGIADRCSYPDGTVCICDVVGQACRTLTGGASGLVPPCPNVVPNNGSPCAFPEGTVCGQNTCDGFSSGFHAATCLSGVWRWDNCLPHVCASPDTPIATPTGERAIADLRVGDVVYSLDRNAVRPVIVARVRRQRVDNHHIVRVTMESGRVLEISGPHPTADGRMFADLRTGGALDGHRLLSVEVVAYAHDYTYDILPASDTGFYFAAGALVGSTMVAAPPPELVCADAGGATTSAAHQSAP